MCVDTWDQGTKLPSHLSFLAAVRTGNGIEEPALGPAKRSWGQGQPAETQSSDVIGKCSVSLQAALVPRTPWQDPGLAPLCHSLS